MKIIFEHTDAEGDTLVITVDADGDLVISSCNRHAVHLPRVQALALRNALDQRYEDVPQ